MTTATIRAGSPVCKAFLDVFGCKRIELESAEPFTFGANPRPQLRVKVSALDPEQLRRAAEQMAREHGRDAETWLARFQRPEIGLRIFADDVDVRQETLLFV